jgi:hypothetical protein
MLTGILILQRDEKLTFLEISYLISSILRVFSDDPVLNR